MFFRDSNITCFTFYIHLSPVYWLSLVFLIRSFLITACAVILGDHGPAVKLGKLRHIAKSPSGPIYIFCDRLLGWNRRPLPSKLSW
jgi:hypothetical protein